MAEQSGEPCTAATENNAGSDTPPLPKDNEEQETINEEEPHIEREDGQQGMNQTDKQDKSNVEINLEQVLKRTHLKQKREQAENDKNKEGDSIKKSTGQSDENEKPEENNKQGDLKTEEPTQEESKAEEGNQGQNTEDHKEHSEDSNMRNENREAQDEDTKGTQIEKDNKQEVKSIEPAENNSELKGNTSGEGGNLEESNEDSSQDENNDEPEPENTKEDEMTAKTSEPTKQNQENKQSSEEGKKDEETRDDKKSQDEHDNEQAEKTEPDKRSETNSLKSKTSLLNFPGKKVAHSIAKIRKYIVVVAGNTRDSHKDFLTRLHKKKSTLKEVNEPEECKFILVFCPVVSRAGTDIEAALRQLNQISCNITDKNTETKPAALVVLHCTNDSESFVPDSSRAVKRENMIAVDCLFHEDKGLYTCSKNNKAVEDVAKWLKTKPWRNGK